jgi:xylan 1,4-beta-xylosidase
MYEGGFMKNLWLCVTVWLLVFEALPAQVPQSFSNPIISGDWSDPAVIRVGTDYYTLRSSFGFRPGVPLAHSTDLLRWQYIGHVFQDHPLIQDGNTRSGVYGSEIGYNPNNKKYLVYVPIDQNNRRIAAYTSDKPAGPYEGPFDVGMPGFDPGFFADDHGKLYLVSNKGVIAELSEDGLKVERQLCNIKRGKMFEGPDLFKRGDYYYCIYCTGGTRPHQNSAISTIRSKDPQGPWQAAPDNPQLKAGDESGAQFQGPAHPTILQSADGRWFVTYHAYELSHYSLGRQMCMEQIEWTDDGWWRPVNGRIPSDATDKCKRRSIRPFSDEFDKRELGLQWFFLASPDKTGWSLTKRKGWLRIHPRPGDMASKGCLSNVFLQRVTREKFSISTRLQFKPEAEKATAGLHFFHDPGMNFWLASTLRNNKRVFEVGKYNKGKHSTLASIPNRIGEEVYLKIEVNGKETAAFYVSPEGRKWQKLDASVYFGDSWHDLREGKGGSPDLGWVGPHKRNVWTATTMGVFAVGGAADDHAPADFDWFRMK